MKPQEMLDHAPVKIGKYKGQTPSQIAEHDPSYLVWAYDNWTPKPCSVALYKSCKEELEENTDDDYDSDMPDTFDRFNGDL